MKIMSSRKPTMIARNVKSPGPRAVAGALVFGAGSGCDSVPVVAAGLAAAGIPTGTSACWLAGAEDWLET